jgi:Ulp1 family protease
MKRTFKIKRSFLLYFSSYFLTLLFNDGHAGPNVEDAFPYRNVKTWLSTKVKCSKTSLKGIRTMVFFRNVGCIHWVTYVIYQDLKIIKEFDSMGPTESGRILKGLYRWLFLEYKIIGIHLDSSEWRLYPTGRTTPRQRNGLDCGVFSILYALHPGLRLNITNITSQQRMPRSSCEILIHLLEISHADHNNEVVVVGPGGREANANNPIHLLDESDDDSDKESDHIDGMSDEITSATMMAI